MKRQSESSRDTRQADAKIPQQPRDCGPNVDTWPILDTQAGEAPKPKTLEKRGNSRP
jgi:hypothetical protein